MTLPVNPSRFRHAEQGVHRRARPADGRLGMAARTPHEVEAWADAVSGRPLPPRSPPAPPRTSRRSSVVGRPGATRSRGAPPGARGHWRGTSATPVPGSPPTRRRTRRPRTTDKQLPLPLPLAHTAASAFCRRHSPRDTVQDGPMRPGDCRGQARWQAGCQSVRARNVLKTGVNSRSWARALLKRGTGGRQRFSGMRSAAARRRSTGS